MLFAPEDFDFGVAGAAVDHILGVDQGFGVPGPATLFDLQEGQS